MLRLLLLLTTVFNQVHLEPVHLNRRFSLSSENCATQDAINEAFQQALSNHDIEDPASIDIQQLAHVLLETSRHLVEKCGIDPIEVPQFLASVDTSGTRIAEHCLPQTTRKVTCDSTSKYRSYDGTCNNLDNPSFGAVDDPYRRLLEPSYADGISSPRRSVTGDPLPSARRISQVVHSGTETIYEPSLTAYHVSWGQLIDHDIVATVGSGDVEGCCPMGSSNHESCMPIEVPAEDPFYSKYGVDCMNFVRSAATVPVSCKLGQIQQRNGLTSLLDASFVYGANQAHSDSLRLGERGLLKTQSPFAHLGLEGLPPNRTEDEDEECFRTSAEQHCFHTGDIRSNQTPMLSAPHALFVREHNRIASELGRLNPSWDDEKIFQEIRRIIAAIAQKITYDEYLPLLVGPETMERFGLQLSTQGHYSLYNDTVNPTLADAFNSAAFRLHSTVPRFIHRWSVSHRFIDRQLLYTIFYQPWDLLKPGYMDQYLVGMMNQNAQFNDNILSTVITNHLEQETDQQFGMDLAALNIQRGRDHGIPSYNQYRDYCLGKRATSWEDFNDHIANETLAAMIQVYASYEDVDLWTAGISEAPVAGGVVGPTFACIIGDTFRNLRMGDRFWFENVNSPYPFTLDQLDEIRKVTLARVICDNGDAIDTVQKHVMKYHDPNTNPRMKCNNVNLIPQMDLIKWKV